MKSSVKVLSLVLSLVLVLSFFPVGAAADSGNVSPENIGSDTSILNNDDAEDEADVSIGTSGVTTATPGSLGTFTDAITTFGAATIDGGYGSNGKFLAPIDPPEVDSIPIDNRAELEKIGNDPSYPQDGKYHLTTDIDLSGSEWVSIGYPYSNRFMGTFDGQGYVISNLTITGSSVYSGLFNSASSATIKNVGLEDTYIEITWTANAVAGGICASASSTSISNCYNIGYVSASSPSRSYDANAGGICGSLSTSSINNCYNLGNVVASSSSSYDAPYDASAGGICGSLSTSSISNSYNRGDVLASSDSYLDTYAGGICGSLSTSSINNCYNMGSVSTSSSVTSYNTYAGGICGSARTTSTSSTSISDCNNTGDVSASSPPSSSSRAHAGGICAYSFSDYSSPSPTIISNCDNTGDVMAYSSIYQTYAGGICGRAYSTNTVISNCYNKGYVLASDSTLSVAYAGGICGYASSYSTTISVCFNMGDVSACSLVAYAGGICGYSSPTTISNSYNMGDVSASDSSDSSYSSDAYAGGICAYSSSSSTSIRYCYNTGNVSVSSDRTYTGGILAYSSSAMPPSISSCYCLNLYDSARGTQLTFEHMKSAASFVGFDFDDVWDISSSVNDGYPFLRSLSGDDGDGGDPIVGGSFEKSAGAFIRQNCEYIYSPIINGKEYFYFELEFKEVVFSNDIFSLQSKPEHLYSYLLDDTDNLVTDPEILIKAAYLMVTNDIMKRGHFQISDLENEKQFMHNYQNQVEQALDLFNLGEFLTGLGTFLLDLEIVVAEIFTGNIIEAPLMFVVEVTYDQYMTYSEEEKSIDVSKWLYSRTSAIIEESISHYDSVISMLKSPDNFENGYLRCYDDAVDLQKTRLCTDLFIEFGKVNLKYLANKVDEAKAEVWMDIGASFFGIFDYSGHMDIMVDIVPMVIDGGYAVVTQISDLTDPDLIKMINRVEKLPETFNASLFPAYNIDAFGNIALIQSKIENNFPYLDESILIACPVDVEVYNKNGKLIGKITDNIADESMKFDFANPLVIFTEGEDKVLIFPYESNYEIKITATEAGIMSYHAQRIHKDGTELEKIHLYNIVLEPVKTFYINSNDNNGINYNFLINEGESIDININVFSSQGGSVSGSRNYTKGDFVRLLAVPNDGYVFNGWYENDSKIADAGLVYIFSATSDRTLEARFITDVTSSLSPTITTSSLSNGTVGTPYNQTLASTGDAPITWSVDSGSLPDGLSLNSATGVISGTPTTEETASFTIKASNSEGDDTKSLTITISAAATSGTAPTITTSNLPDGTVGSAYSQALTATGDVPITWSVESGSLPGGLSLNSGTGVISGTPTTEETANFTVKASNNEGDDTKLLTITINAAATSDTAPTITTSNLPDGTMGSAYSQALTATGDAPITWSVESGNLPDGLNLNSTTGVISGTPTTKETANFTVKASNSEGNDTKPLSIVISAATSSTTYAITAIAGTGGSVSGGGIYSENAAVTLIATPNSGYAFEGWYENSTKISGASATYTFTITSDRTLEARFTQSGGGQNGGNTSNNSSDSDSGSSTRDSDRASGAQAIVRHEGIRYITEDEIRAAIQMAQESGSNLVKTRASYSYGHIAITPKVLALLEGYEYIHDTTGSPVQVRVRIPEPEKITSNLNLCGSVTGSEVEKTRARFEKWFPNAVRVVSLHQHEPWGQTIQLAARVDLAGMDTQNLHFYSYDKETNKYNSIDTNYSIDNNGYLHFASSLAGDIVVSNGPLTKETQAAPANAVNDETGTSASSSGAQTTGDILQNPETGGDGLDDMQDTNNPLTGGDGYAYGNVNSHLLDSNDYGKLRNEVSVIMIISIILPILLIALMLWAFIPRKDDEYITVEEFHKRHD